MLVALAIGALACTVSDCLTREPAVITHQNDRTRSFGFYGRLPACQGLGPLQYLSCVSRSADQDAISLLRRPPGREAAAIKSSAAWLKTIISKEPAFCSLCKNTPHRIQDYSLYLAFDACQVLVQCTQQPASQGGASCCREPDFSAWQPYHARNNRASWEVWG